MEAAQVRNEIRELEKVRTEAKWWRTGGTVAAIAIVAICVGLLYSSANGLIKKGPTQDIYITEVRQSLNEDIVPRIQQTASQTLTEMQPIVQEEFTKLNERVPELTKATLSQVEQLQTSIPERSGKVLEETFGQALKDQEPEIRKMFPSATDEQVKTLMTNLANMAQTRGGEVATELLQPHTNRMHSIVENLHKIEASEPQTAAGENADWHMGILVFDLVRDDFKGLEPKLAMNETPAKVTAKPGAAK